MDVDKFDYMARDSYAVGLKERIDFKLLMKEARIIDDELCYPAKYVMNVYDVFYQRFKLYKTIYLNRISQSIEQMLCDVFMLTNHHFHFDKVIFDPKEYYKINDSVLEEIERSNDP